MKKPAKQILSKDYKTTSFILLTIAFFGFFAIRPSITLIFSLQKEKAEYQKINETLEVKIQQIINTQTKYMQLLDKKDLIDKAIPNSNKIEKTEDLLTKKLEVTSFLINRFKILPEEKIGLNRIQVNLSGAGTYSDLSSFISDIYQTRRLFSITQINIEKDLGATQSAALNLTTTLNTYYYVDSHE